MDHELLTCEEAAQYLRLHCRTVYRFLEEGRLPGAGIGRQRRILRADLDADRRAASAPRRPTQGAVGALRPEVPAGVSRGA